ncbi:LysR family transcriptional regulator [Microbacterium resistens]|uniref:LysR family transcriptional regulator n=1 Tax=Microbacterium resistens TaxID=156977 RepID=UPI00082DF7EF|nr:LysR family transcriptional regulator [Microbacterium resistens]
METMRTVPDLPALELLAAVARHGSISAGAREVGVTQQSASARLRSVERQVGLELFRRSPGGVRPTPAGEVVVSWGEEVLAAASRLRAGIETLREESRRELTVAASQTVSAHLLPGWLVDLRGRQQDEGRIPTAVTLATGNSESVIARVRSGAADLGFIETPRVPDDLASTAVTTDELVLVVGPGHAWSRRDEVSLAEVAAAPIVAREPGSGTRDAWERTVRKRLGYDAPEPAAVLPTSAAVRSAVAGGLGVALLSGRAVADDIRLGRLHVVPIAGERLIRPITALWRGTTRDLTPTSRTLLEVAAAGGS